MRQLSKIKVTEMLQELNRRPIAMRQTVWAQALASLLSKQGFTPNQVSLLSIAFSILGSGMLLLSSTVSADVKTLCLVSAALCIPLRLVCNMIDGMIAVEYDLQSKTGALFNEIPDRLSDSVFLICAGYAAQTGQLGIALGWAAALLAALTAYIRVLGGSQGLAQDFCGPMAKQQRMAVLALCCLFAAVEVSVNYKFHALLLGLALIAVGSLFTCVRRTTNLAKALENRS